MFEDCAVGLGLVLVVAGVAVIYWPVAVILAGIALCAVGLRAAAR